MFEDEYGVWLFEGGERAAAIDRDFGSFDKLVIEPARAAFSDVPTSSRHEKWVK